MTSDDGNIDYSQYSRRELYDARRAIDSAQYPLNAQRLNEAIEAADLAAREQSDEVESAAEENSKYSTVWERIAAQLIDGLIIMMPFFAIGAWLGGESRSNYISIVVVSIFVNLWFNVYLVKRYGGTPGKLFMNLRIARLDETRVTYREAMLRYVVMFVLSLSSQIALVIGAGKMTDSEFGSLSWMEQSARIAELAPSWHGISQMIVSGWIVVLLILLFTNKERRTLHDYIAGTVVLRTGEGVM